MENESAPNNCDDETSQGGKGGEKQGDTTTDARLALRAIRERWEMPEEKRATLMKMLFARALSKKSTERGAISAAKAILTADAQNMEQERRELKIPEYVEERITVVAEELTDDDLAKLVSDARRGSRGTPETPPSPPQPD